MSLAHLNELNFNLPIEVFSCPYINKLFTSPIVSIKKKEKGMVNPDSNSFAYHYYQRPN